jgi:MFS family permease
MKLTQIQKLYLSNFLTGLVFWYGIEKLFMRSIGINAVGVAAATAALTVFLVMFDIPAGILADKWSRKGVLVLSAVSLAIASLLTGESHGLSLYIVGDLFYGLYVVTSSGTYQAIIYDSLHEENKSDQYSKINGKIYALFLVGAGVGDVASGFLAHQFGFRASYLLTIIPCLLNAAVILSLHEPRFHKSLGKEKLLRQIGKATITVSKIKLVRTLAVVLTLFAVIELFKLEFGQLYMFRYVTAAQAIGTLWAVYSFSMAFGSLIAHKFRARLHTLIVCAVLPLVLMSVIDNRFSLVLFMVQAVATAALLNQIETRIQENTPSHVRASVLSVISTFGRAVAVPASFILGWLFKDYNALIAVRFIAVVALVALFYWLIASRNIPKANEPLITEELIPA